MSRVKVAEIRPPNQLISQVRWTSQLRWLIANKSLAVDNPNYYDIPPALLDVLASSIANWFMHPPDHWNATYM